MEIRPTAAADVPQIVAIYDAARAFMRAHGNPSQWAGAYPGEQDVLEDIAAGRGYVCVEGGLVAGTFAFFLGEEPTYRVIERGSWRSDAPYGVIHRVASGGTARGVARACFDYCKGRAGHLRIDTHEDNAPMRGAILKNGFQYRGVIHIEDGSPRLAYDWLRG